MAESSPNNKVSNGRRRFLHRLGVVAASLMMTTVSGCGDGKNEPVQPPPKLPPKPDQGK